MRNSDGNEVHELVENRKKKWKGVGEKDQAKKNSEKKGRDQLADNGKDRKV